MKRFDAWGESQANTGLTNFRAKPKTVIVTGGAGFLGSTLCDRLIKAGSQVICVDNLLSGRLVNVAHLEGNPAFSFIKHDVIDPLAIDGPVDEIFNLACAASPPIYQRDPIHTFRTNTVGAANMLDLARDKGARILQASTSEVYGDPDVTPQSESYTGHVNTHGPRSCYDEGKRGAETLFHDYYARYGVVTKTARIFNTYGPNMRPDDGRVVSNFIMQALQGQDLTIYGDGTQTRSFCYRDDMIDALLALMASPPDLADPVNLGNPGEFTVLELAEKVIEKTGTRSRLSFRDLPFDDPRQRRPDITRARTKLGWHPRVSLDDGLDLSIPYFASTLKVGEVEFAEVV